MDQKTHDELLTRALESTNAKIIGNSGAMFERVNPGKEEKLMRQVQVQVLIQKLLYRDQVTPAVKYEDRTYHCPECHAEVLQVQRFCHDCGQRLNWR